MATLFCPEQGEEIQTEALFQKAVSYYETYRYCDALPLFRQAAEAGHPQAMRYLGWFLENGYCVPADMAQAARWYKAASDAGDSMASGYLAILYDSVTTDFPTDYREAFQLYSLSISQGAATGTTYNNLAVLYMNGTGTVTDGAMAERLLQKAVSLGNRLAQCNLEVLSQRLPSFRRTCPRCGSGRLRKEGPMVCQDCGMIF